MNRLYVIDCCLDLYRSMPRLRDSDKEQVRRLLAEKRRLLPNDQLMNERPPIRPDEQPPQAGHPNDSTTWSVER